MWSVSMIDPKRRLLELVWAGRVEPEEVPQANEKLAEYIRTFNGQPWDLLVDTSKLVTFPPETLKLIVEQQKWVLSQGMRRSAVVTPSQVVNVTLDITRRKSGHEEEYKFSTREGALAFLMQG